MVNEQALNVKLANGEVLLENLLARGVSIAHDCDGTLACSTCRIVVLEGEEALSAPSEDELDMLDRGGATGPGARLSCQVVGAAELVVEIPCAEAPRHEESNPVSVSKAAARYLANQLAKRNAVAVRLAVEPSGCSGFGYRLDHVDSLRPDDVVFESEGIRIAVDPSSLPFVQGTRVDLVREGLAQRLRFENPNARQSCGCGESFGT